MSDTFVEVTPSVAADNCPAALREEVLRRMEVLVLEALVGALSLSCAPDSRSATPDNIIAASHRVDVASTLPLRVLHTTRNRLLVLRVLFANVHQRTVQTQRDVYYHLVREVPAQVVVNRTVQQLARVLRVPRELMGVTAGGRGYIAGAVRYHGTSLEGPTFALEGMPLPLLEAELRVTCGVRSGKDDNSGDVEDAWGVAESSAACLSVRRDVCQRRTDTWEGDGDMASTSSSSSCSGSTSSSGGGFIISPHVRFIVVVEKHAVFSHLLRGRLTHLLPCVVLTAQGYPTHAAHRLLANLHAALPRAVVVGLADYNPHGLAILSAYRWPSSSSSSAAPTTRTETQVSTTGATTVGSRSGMPENRFCAVPTLRWLGMRAAHVHVIAEMAHRTAENGVARAAVLSDSVEHHDGEVGLLCRRESTGASCAGRRDGGSASTVRRLEPGHASLPVQHKRSAQKGDHTGASSAPSTLAPPPPPPAVAAPSPSPLPPLQPLFSRDTVLLENLTKQLEARLGGGHARSEHHADNADRHCSAPIRPLTVVSAAKCTWASDDDDEEVSVRAWLREAREMRRRAVRCELEALYTPPFAACFSGGAAAAVLSYRTPAARGDGHEAMRTSPASFAAWVAQQLLWGQYI